MTEEIKVPVADKKLPCSKCGKQITTRPGPRANHMRNCKGVEVEEQSPVIVIDPMDIPKPDDSKIQPKMSANPTLADEVRYAEEKQANIVAEVERVRKEAPNATVSFTAALDAFKAEEKLQRQLGNLPEGVATYWGDITEHRANLSKYIPVNDRGRQPQVGKNELFYRDPMLKRAEIAAAEEQSKAMFDSEYELGGESKKALKSDAAEPTKEIGKLLK